MKFEILCGNVEDCILAQEGGADRIELNSGTLLGGLTPSLGTYLLAKEKVSIPIVVMIRPRGAGFYYSELEKEAMFEDARIFLEAGVDGIVFGFLHADGTLDVETTERMVKLAHSFGKEAIYHRAIDNSLNPEICLQGLIELNVDRVLTSAGKEFAYQATDILAKWQSRYGDKIEILPGGGVTSENVVELVESTGCTQAHGSFKIWHSDPTSKLGEINDDFFMVNPEEVKKAIQNIQK